MGFLSFLRPIERIFPNVAHHCDIRASKAAAIECADSLVFRVSTYAAIN